jgi:hypothetical protein
MKDICIIIKKNNYDNPVLKDNIFYIKSVLNYALNITENNILLLDYSLNIEEYYHNISCIKDYAYSLVSISKRTLYVYIDNNHSDMIHDTYASLYFYSILQIFISTNIFIQYAGIITYLNPIFKYYLTYNIENITVELSEVDNEFNTSILVIDNFTINDMVLNLIEFYDDDVDFFSFILNNVKCTIYSNLLITTQSFLFQHLVNKDMPDDISECRCEQITVFRYNKYSAIKNFLLSIYEINNEINLQN